MVREKYHIKGMICSRCLKVLDNELKALGVIVANLQLGSVEVEYDPEKSDGLEIEQIIWENGFDILRNKESILAEQTKRWIIKYIWATDQSQNLSDFLTFKMGLNYATLSRNFSKEFGKTIERYYVMLKMERVKEWIEYGEKNFSQMAYDLRYQNPSALSRQFKRETGMSMKTYKNLNIRQRIPLDKL